MTKNVLVFLHANYLFTTQYIKELFFSNSNLKIRYIDLFSLF
jgi:hypothetical protein